MTTAADMERLGASRCVNCDRPRATQHDYDTIPGGEGEHLCWADYESSCEPEDWRTRALKAERERDEARAEVERLRAALEKVMLCSHPPTGKACNCFRQGDAALRRSTPLATEGDK